MDRIGMTFLESFLRSYVAEKEEETKENVFEIVEKRGTIRKINDGGEETTAPKISVWVRENWANNEKNFENKEDIIPYWSTSWLPLVDEILQFGNKRDGKGGHLVGLIRICRKIRNWLLRSSLIKDYATGNDVEGKPCKPLSDTDASEDTEYIQNSIISKFQAAKADKVEDSDLTAGETQNYAKKDYIWSEDLAGGASMTAKVSDVTKASVNGLTTAMPAAGETHQKEKDYITDDSDNESDIGSDYSFDSDVLLSDVLP